MNILFFSPFAMIDIKLIKRRHNYYNKSGFYNYLAKNIFKIIAILTVTVIAFVILQKWVIDLDVIFSSFFSNMANELVIVLFTISESFLGLIPPDFFIIWSRKFQSPWAIVTLLAILSYIGGIISYYIGKRIRKINRLNCYLTSKFSDHFSKIKKWGSLFIIIAALFPLPYSTICIISGILKFPFKIFALIGISRILRFYLYALVLFGLLK